MQLSSVVTCLLSIITTAITAYKYGTWATANILEILPQSNALYVAIMLVTLQLCLSSAVGHSALFQNLEDWLRIPKGKSSTDKRPNMIYIILSTRRVQLVAVLSTFIDNRFWCADCRTVAKIWYGDGNNWRNTHRPIDFHFATTFVPTNLPVSARKVTTLTI